MEFLRKLALKWKQGSFQRQLEAWQELASHQAAQDRSCIMSKFMLLEIKDAGRPQHGARGVASLHLRFRQNIVSRATQISLPLFDLWAYPRALQQLRRYSGMETEREIAILVEAIANWRENVRLQPGVSMLQARIRRRVAAPARYADAHPSALCIAHLLPCTHSNPAFLRIYGLGPASVKIQCAARCRRARNMVKTCRMERERDRQNILTARQALLLDWLHRARAQMLAKVGDRLLCFEK
jgi:hypothetical protein